MAVIDVGRTCIKKAGRDAGSEVVVTQILDHNYVMVKSKLRKDKERKCAIVHLEPKGSS
ncbi:50S ribosomal protein L14e [Candidatus Micrarchaeota archaeon]|nr:50S ribosomal protein L14e [Candidatus Micrarchaeota archaeon]